MTAPTDAVPRPPPSQDDRALAVCAHLSFLIGFWLVAPIAIYVVKRKESHFVAFAALQAAVVQLLFAVATVGGVVLFVVLIAATGLSGRHELGIAAAIIPFVGIFVGGLALFLVHAYAAFSAWRGVNVDIPLAGWIARAIQNADDGALKAGPLS
jgi:uncharacterized Tic20 family protein